MVRRWLAVACTLFLVAILPLASADHLLVEDDAGLYTPAEIRQMEELIEEMRVKYQMDIGVLTTYAVPSGPDSVTVAYADAWYEDQGFGMGEDRAGVLFLLDMTNRFNYLSTAGTMADYLNDHRIEELLSSADEDLRAGRYGNAMLSQLNKLKSFLRAGIEEGSFRYDVRTGQRLTGLYNKLTLFEFLAALVCAFTAGGALFAKVLSRYTLRGKTYRYSLGLENVQLDLQQDEAQFLREHVTRTRIPDGDGGGGGGGGGGRGSGMHTSSGGMSHGGGGHHF